MIPKSKTYLGASGRLFLATTLLVLTVTLLTAASALGPQPELQPRKKAGRIVRASWYGPKFHGKIMANGQPFNMHALTVAHRTIPLGTRLILKNPRNGKKVKVRVTDRGPFVRGRQLDVSYAVAQQLGFVEQGVARLRMQILG